MSSLAAFRPLPDAVPTLLSASEISEANPFDGSVREAVDALGSGDYIAWRSVTPADGEWDDLVNEVSGFGPPPAASALEDALLELATCSAECVVWYPGDDLTQIPVVDDEVTFARSIVAMVASGDIEPQLHFVRPR